MELHGADSGFSLSTGTQLINKLCSHGDADIATDRHRRYEPGLMIHIWWITMLQGRSWMIQKRWLTRPADASRFFRVCSCDDVYISHRKFHIGISETSEQVWLPYFSCIVHGPSRLASLCLLRGIV